MRRARCAVLVVAALALVAVARPAPGDGGLVRARETSGPFTITLFTSPTPLRAGEADVSVLVQEAGGATVLDAEVALEVEPEPRATRGAGAGALPHAAGDRRRVLLTRAQATNRLLHAGRVALEHPGRFRLRATVARGVGRGAVNATVEVAPALPRALALWPYLALPPVAIVLFLFHQWLRGRTRRTRSAFA